MLGETNKSAYVEMHMQPEHAELVARPVGVTASSGSAMSAVTDRSKALYCARLKAPADMVSSGAVAGGMSSMRMTSDTVSWCNQWSDSCVVWLQKLLLAIPAD